MDTAVDPVIYLRPDQTMKAVCDFRWWQHEESEENVVLMDADGARFQEYLIEAIYELGEKLQ